MNVLLQARATDGASLCKPLFGGNPIPRAPRISVFGPETFVKGQHHHPLIFDATLSLD
jgi:hypothetical protein